MEYWLYQKDYFFMFAFKHLNEVKRSFLEIEERINALQDMLYRPITHATCRPVEDKTIVMQNNFRGKPVGRQIGVNKLCNFKTF